METIERTSIEEELINLDRLIRFQAKKMNILDDYIQNDLIAVGRIGVLNAYHKYDPSRNVPFNTFAFIYIKKEMVNYMDNNLRTIRIPKNALYDKDFISTTNCLSLSTRIGESSSLIDLIPLEVSQPTNEFEFVRSHLNALKHKDQLIIKMYFGINYEESFTLQEISDVLGCTKQNVSLHIKRIINILKNNKKLKYDYYESTN